MNLATARLQTLVWSADIDKSERFYSGTLELPLSGRSHGALVYEVGGGSLRVSPVPSTAPSEHTVFGMEIDDIDEVVSKLTAKGVRFECFPGFSHDANGIWSTPDGTRVAWFRDPDGNLISLVRYGTKCLR
jgi:catechol 2,3-dioxygenase-like lactoylglutathione lyase family enzyme